jgi:hypothetical protein
MKRLILCAILGVFGMATTMFGDVVDYMLNVNGTTYCPATTEATCTSTGGLAAAGATGTLDTTFGGTGLGTVDLTFNPGSAGTYNAGFWVFEELFPPSGQNEYGTSGGTLAAGQTWQIDTPDFDLPYDPNTGLPSGAGSIIANTAASTLDNTNYIPGTQSQYSYDCGPSPNCNDYTSMAQSFNFTLGAGQEEVLSFTVSTTKPTGFYLEQIAPVDGANNTEIDYYYSASATTESVCTSDCSSVPEPSSLIPLLAFAGVLALVLRRRFAVV